MSPKSSDRPRISLPTTPPQKSIPVFGSYVTSSPTSYTTPTSSPTRSVVMGALVSRPSSPEWDEKRSFSIDVPGITLTEPPINRALSPPPKSITLLPPTSVELELPLKNEHSHPSSSNRPTFSSSLRAAFPSRTTRAKTFSSCGLRSIFLLILMVLGIWHLYATLSIGQGDEEYIVVGGDGF